MNADRIPMKKVIAFIALLAGCCSCTNYQKRADGFIASLPSDATVFAKSTEKQNPYVLYHAGNQLVLHSLENQQALSVYDDVHQVEPLLSPDKRNILFIVKRGDSFNAAHYAIGSRRLENQLVPEYCTSFKTDGEGAVLSILDTWYRVDYAGKLAEKHTGLQYFMKANGIDSEIFHVFDVFGKKCVYYFKYPDKKTHHLALFDENRQKAADFPVSSEERLSRDRTGIFIITSEQNGKKVLRIDVDSGEMTLLDSGKFAYFWDNYIEVNLTNGENHYYDWNGNRLESVPWQKAKDAVQGFGSFLGNALGKIFE